MRPKATPVYVDKAVIEQRKSILLSAEKSHYLRKVMRVKKSDTIEIVDGAGGRYEGAVQEVTKKGVVLTINSIKVEHHPYSTILCQAIIKGYWMDEIVQQVTELGIKEVYPLITERTVPRDIKRLSRWRKIAEESTEQCGRSHLTIIHEPITLDGLLRSFSSQSQGIGILFNRGDGDIQDAISDMDKTFYLAIGPEGGFSDREIARFSESGFVSVSLGRFTIRAKNAAPLAVALTHYFLDRHNRGR